MTQAPVSDLPVVEHSCDFVMSRHSPLFASTQVPAGARSGVQGSTVCVEHVSGGALSSLSFATLKSSGGGWVIVEGAHIL